MKKFLSIVLSIAILSLPSATAAAAESSEPFETNTPSIYLSATDKISFAAEMDKLYAKQSLQRNAKTPTREIVDALLLQIPNASPTEKETLNAELASYGVYEFEAPVIERPTSRTGSGDVTIAVPTIYYEAWSTYWSITCGGSWNNTNYGDSIGNVGGPDGFGVGYTNTNNDYRSYVVSASAYLTDQNYEYYESTSNRSDGEGDKGFGFRLQDKWHMSYVGHIWSGICTYDKNFSYYSGVATAYYIHTYGSASLTEVSFGVSGKIAGINAKINFVEKSFTAFSNDKVIGVYP